MRRLIAILVVVGLMMVVLATGALAASPNAGCPVGPSGTGGSNNEAWVLWDEATLADAAEAAGHDPAEASLEFGQFNKNNDDLLCVMVQVLPNDASGADTWFVTHDNNAREK
jgi:hypothetical protein